MKRLIVSLITVSLLIITFLCPSEASQSAYTVLDKSEYTEAMACIDGIRDDIDEIVTALHAVRRSVDSKQMEAILKRLDNIDAQCSTLYGMLHVDENVYIGNKSSKKFHYPWCTSVAEMKESNKVTLRSREEAIRSGYTPCKICNP